MRVQTETTVMFEKGDDVPKSLRGMSFRAIPAEKCCEGCDLRSKEYGGTRRDMRACLMASGAIPGGCGSRGPVLFMNLGVMEGAK